MHEKYSIRLRVSSSFPPFNNGIELDWSKFSDWNEPENKEAQNSYIQINSDSDTQPEPISRRRKRRKLSKKKQIS